MARVKVPADLGYYMPPEWGLHRAVWLSWPCSPHIWPDAREEIVADFAKLAVTLSHYEEEVRINAEASHHDEIRVQLGKYSSSFENIVLYDIPTNDVWCRDHGPTFLKNKESGARALVNWQFNAWGEKYPPWDLDNMAPQRMGEALSLPVYTSSLICEGGALEVSSARDLLVTESVLLARNANLSKREIEKELQSFLGVKRVIWLKAGLLGDDTDGHIDTFARFTPSGKVLLSWPNSACRANRESMAQNRKILEKEGFDVVLLSHPDGMQKEGGEVLPATYANFYLGNGFLLYPSYLQEELEDGVRSLLETHYPNRAVIPFDCSRIIQEGGAIHCLTQQEIL